MVPPYKHKFKTSRHNLPGMGWWNSGLSERMYCLCIMGHLFRHRGKLRWAYYSCDRLIYSFVWTMLYLHVSRFLKACQQAGELTDKDRVCISEPTLCKFNASILKQSSSRDRNKKDTVKRRAGRTHTVPSKTIGAARPIPLFLLSTYNILVWHQKMIMRDLSVSIHFWVLTSRSVKTLRR